MTPAIVRPAAAGDIEQAFGWYEEQRPGLGREFLDALRETVNVVREHPEAFPVLHRGARRALVRRRFPYGLFYRLEGGTIVIVACLHVRRDPRLARAR